MDSLATKVQEKQTVEFVRAGSGPSEFREWATFSESLEKVYVSFNTFSKEGTMMLLSVVIILVAMVAGMIEAILIMLTRGYYDTLFMLFKMIFESYKWIMTAVLSPFYGFFGKIVTTKENLSTSGPENKV